MEENRNYADQCGDHGGTNSRGEPCGRAAGWGTDFDSGKCRQHRGTSPDGSSHEGNNNAAGNDGGAPINNDNAEQFGLFAERRKWYERQSEETQLAIKNLHQHWVDHANNPGGASAILWDAAIDEFRIGQADEYIDDKGLIVENSVGYDEERGEAQMSREENPALLPKDRFRKTNLRVLKDTGVIESADDRIAGAMEDGLETTSKLGEETKEILRDSLRQRYESDD